MTLLAREKYFHFTVSYIPGKTYGECGIVFLHVFVVVVAGDGSNGSIMQPGALGGEGGRIQNP